MCKKRWIKLKQKQIHRNIPEGFLTKCKKFKVGKITCSTNGENKEQLNVLRKKQSGKKSSRLGSGKEITHQKQDS